MAYNNEFPHFDSNKMNLDWILEQYSTFNKRLQEIMTAFQEAVDEMEEDVDSIRTYTHEQIAQVREDFESFTAQINENFDDLSDDIQEQVQTSITNIYNTIDRLSNNMGEYVAEHMDDWQVEASYSNMTVDNLEFKTLKLSNEADPDIDNENPINTIQLDGKLKPILLRPAPNTHNIAGSFTSILNGYIQGVNQPVLNGKGIFALFINIFFNYTTAPATSKVFHLDITSVSGTNNLVNCYQTFILDENHLTEGVTFNAVALIENSTDLNKMVTIKVTETDDTNITDIVGIIQAYPLKISG